MREYYVYLYYIIETKEVFYVGKGKGNRSTTGKRNKFCEDMKSTHNWSCKIVESSLTEREAFEREMFYISEYSKLGRLTNQTLGGEGASGFAHTSKSKEALSKSSKKLWEDKKFRDNQIWHRKNGVYQSAEFKEKISQLTKGENNGNYQNRWTDEMKHSLSQKLIKEGNRKGTNNSRATKIRCVETGEIFDYIRLACEKYDIKSQASITIALNNPSRTAYGFHWERI